MVFGDLSTFKGGGSFEVVGRILFGILFEFRGRGVLVLFFLGIEFGGIFIDK